MRIAMELSKLPIETLDEFVHRLVESLPLPPHSIND
jgi:hypothetical protein